MGHCFEKQGLDFQKVPRGMALKLSNQSFRHVRGKRMADADPVFLKNIMTRQDFSSEMHVDFLHAFLTAQGIRRIDRNQVHVRFLQHDGAFAVTDRRNAAGHEIKPVERRTVDGEIPFPVRIQRADLFDFDPEVLQIPVQGLEFPDDHVALQTEDGECIHSEVYGSRVVPAIPDHGLGTARAARDHGSMIIHRSRSWFKDYLHSSCNRFLLQ